MRTAERARFGRHLALTACLARLWLSLPASLASHARSQYAKMRSIRQIDWGASSLSPPPTPAPPVKAKPPPQTDDDVDDVTDKAAAVGGAVGELSAGVAACGLDAAASSPPLSAGFESPQ